MIGLIKDIKASPNDWTQERKILFLHTGGLLSMYEKAEQLEPIVASNQAAQRLNVTTG